MAEPTTEPEFLPTPIFEYIYEEGDVRKSWNVPFYHGVKNQWNPNGKVLPTPDALNWTFSPGKFRRWDAAYPDDIEATNASLQPIITLESPEPINQNFTGINYPVLRFSDVLLMFAEASNEFSGGPTAEAVAAVDLVRNRAGLEKNGNRLQSKCLLWWTFN